MSGKAGNSANWDKARSVRMPDPLWEEAGRACRYLRTDRSAVTREAFEAVIAKAEAVRHGRVVAAAAAEQAAEGGTCTCDLDGHSYACAVHGEIP